MTRPKYKIRDAIILQLQGLKLTDDSILDPEFIEDQIDMIRETLIREVFTNKENMDSFYQVLRCLEIECASASECSIAGIDVISDEKVFYVEPPALVTQVGWMDIRYLGSDDLGNNFRFSRKTLDGWFASDGNRWTGHKPIFTPLGEKLLLKNLPSPTPRLLTMVGLFKHPEDTCDWNSENNYPVPSETKLQTLVIKFILGSMGIPRDLINDALSNPAMPQTQSQNANG